MLASKWQNLLSFAYAAYLIMWMLLASGQLVSLALSGELLFLADGPRICDFVNHYMAGSMVFSADSQRVYDPAVQLSWCNRLIAPGHIDRVFYFQYPPHAFVLLAPLSLMPIYVAYWCWSAASLAAACAALVSVLGRRSVPSVRAPIFLLGVMASMPAWLTLRLGQWSLFVLALICLYFAALRSGRGFAAGIGLALASVKLQYLPFLAVPLLVLRRWQAAAWALTAGASLLAMAGILLGWQTIAEYPSVLAHAETSGFYTGVAPTEMVNLRGLVAGLMPGAPQEWLIVSSTLTGIAVTLAIWTVAARSAAWDWALALTVVACLIFAPHVHAQDLVLLALPAALTLQSTSLFSRAGSRWATGWQSVLVLYPILSWILLISMPVWHFVHCQPFALIDLYLLAAGFMAMRDQPAVDRR